MLRKVRLLTVLLALIVLASGTAYALPLRASRGGASESAGVWDRVWDWLASFFRAMDASGQEPKALWEKEGSHLDPHG